MTHRFLRDYRGNRTNDPVPAAWDWGTVDSLIRRGIVEAVPAHAEVVTAAISSPPEDKAITSPARGKVRRK